MFTESTIAAISTPPGHSGIGIVRLSGKDAIPITDKIFFSLKKKSLVHVPSHRILYGHIKNSDKEVLDEVLVSVMRAPHTYTREDVVEINCHGGPVPLRGILELVLNAGATLAEPGEFTRRAFLNGRIDLAQAEAVLDTIHSLTEQGQRAAIEQLRGGLSKKIEDMRRKVINLTAFVESHIDFPEEDIDLLSLKDMKKMAYEIQESLKRLIETSRYGMILREGLETAIIGRPNVGKSSILNRLLQHEKAIVTAVPGTTRDVIEDYLNIQGIPIKIMDTAGIRAVKDIAEKEGVKRSLRAMKDAGLVLIILDGSEVLHNTDRDLIAKSCPENTILVINKSDLPQKLIPPYPFMGGHMQTISVSALKGTRFSELKHLLAKIALEGTSVCSTGIVTNIRHVRALEKALFSMNSFIQGITEISPEFLAVELRDALDAIGEILGITTPEDILNKIFSDFCIGK